MSRFQNVQFPVAVQRFCVKDKDGIEDQKFSIKVQIVHDESCPAWTVN